MSGAKIISSVILKWGVFLGLIYGLIVFVETSSSFFKWFAIMTGITFLPVVLYYCLYSTWRMWFIEKSEAFL